MLEVLGGQPRNTLELKSQVCLALVELKDGSSTLYGKTLQQLKILLAYNREFV